MTLVGGGAIMNCFGAFQNSIRFPQRAERKSIWRADASAYFARPGPRIVDSLEIVAEILYPKEFPEFTSRGSEDPRSVRVA
jgi:hypothetical protein